ncbi:hypothetical protein [Kitasatospora griseola]|uniref:hypothetical protein n=1 Tax=Kitasatospora griseola TaxID=2064 RepID=UPI00166FA910|nr:hypothetical protein [Kitasatospora griseola]GGQ80399.1 hypothetical protein GCM10010195_40100 [Kitasatospora griseola]
MLKGLIANEWTPDEKLRRSSGPTVADEISGRCLLRYLRPDQRGAFFKGITRKQYVTVTAYTPEEASVWLALVFPWVRRQCLLLIDPTELGDDTPVMGPRAILGGFGIEYILPNGFPAESIAEPGCELEIT